MTMKEEAADEARVAYTVMLVPHAGPILRPVESFGTAVERRTHSRAYRALHIVNTWAQTNTIRSHHELRTRTS
jgi:hypothetical protein